MPPSQVTLDPEIQQKTVIRRYIDLPKLLDLLHTKALYFRRADSFADRLEGALFPALRASLDAAHKVGEIQHGADYFYRRARLGSFVSCWTLGAQDSMAHWQLYAGVQTGVVVTSTVERLVRCALSFNRDAIIHRVKYVDHLKIKDFAIDQYADVLQFKHEAYKHEKELRILIPQQSYWESNPISLRLQLPELDSLIRSVVVAPEADFSFYDAVKELCKRYGLTAPVRRSKLAFVPV